MMRSYTHGMARSGFHLLSSIPGNDIDIDGAFVHIENVIDFVDIINLTDNSGIVWNDPTDASLTWETAGNDHLQITTGVNDPGYSGNIIIGEFGDRTTDWGHAVSLDPRLYIQSADATDTAEFISFQHNTDAGQIEVGQGNLNLIVPGNVGINVLTPSSNFDVSGNVSFGGNLSVAGNFVGWKCS